MQRHRLGLKDKVEVIQVQDREKLSARALAERFDVSERNIYNILGNKDNILKSWQGEDISNSPSVMNQSTLNFPRESEDNPYREKYHSLLRRNQGTSNCQRNVESCESGSSLSQEETSESMSEEETSE